MATLMLVAWPGINAAVPAAIWTCLTNCLLAVVGVGRYCHTSALACCLFCILSPYRSHGSLASSLLVRSLPRASHPVLGTGTLETCVSSVCNVSYAAAICATLLLPTSSHSFALMGVEAALKVHHQRWTARGCARR